jgi:tetratricopeptide (TPR) repeat protein
MEYTAASVHFEEAGHERFQACVENNLGYLFGAVRKFDEAHEHLDRAQMLMTRLKDNVHLAQVDETRAGVLLAEGRTVEAEKTARAAVLRLEKGDEFSLLAEALTTHGIALAQLHHPEQARTALDRAVDVAEQAGDCEGAGIAALTLIEQLSANLSAEEVCATVDRARVLLEKTENTDTVRRLSRSAFQALFLTHSIAAPSDWTNFSLRQSVLRYEGSLITLALNQSGGSVTKAARLLGFRHHQSLAAIIDTRHRELLTKRLPVRKRREHLMAHPKRKPKQPK